MIDLHQLAEFVRAHQTELWAAAPRRAGDCWRPQTPDTVRLVHEAETGQWAFDRPHDNWVEAAWPGIWRVDCNELIEFVRIYPWLVTPGDESEEAENAIYSAVLLMRRDQVRRWALADDMTDEDFLGRILFSNAHQPEPSVSLFFHGDAIELAVPDEVTVVARLEAAIAFEVGRLNGRVYMPRWNFDQRAE